MTLRVLVQYIKKVNFPTRRERDQAIINEMN